MRATTQSLVLRDRESAEGWSRERLSDVTRVSLCPRETEHTDPRLLLDLLLHLIVRSPDAAEEAMMAYSAANSFDNPGRS